MGMDPSWFKLDRPMIIAVSYGALFFMFPPMRNDMIKLACVIRNYNERSVLFDLLACDLISDQEPLPLPPQVWIERQEITVIEYIETEDLPLLVGWKMTFPLLAELLKEA